MSKVYACLKNNYAHFNRFDMEPTIARIKKNLCIIRLPSSQGAGKFFFCVDRVNETKVTRVYL